MFTRESLKRQLKRKGWTYRTAALHLGRAYQHLSEVLNGHRTSRSLDAKIAALPVTKKQLRASRKLAEVAR